jgi:hypothetical protein
MFGPLSNRQPTQASPNPFSLLGHLGIRWAARSGAPTALVQTVWSNRHGVVRRISLTSTIVALVICVATWRLSGIHLGQSGHDIIAAKTYATTRTDTYTHVHPRLRLHGESVIVTHYLRYSQRRYIRGGSIYVSAFDYWAHEIASWLNPIAFWGMVLTPLFMMERLWARRRSRTTMSSPASHQSAGSDPGSSRQRKAQAPFSQAQAMPVRATGQSGALNQALFGC